jgi:hypothetical protein
MARRGQDKILVSQAPDIVVTLRDPFTPLTPHSKVVASTGCGCVGSCRGVVKRDVWEIRDIILEDRS